MAKKPRVRVLSGGRKELNEFLDKLQNVGSKEEFEALFQGEPENLKPCGSPVCPCCMWHMFPGDNGDQLHDAVRGVFGLLTMEELLHGLVITYGTAARVVDDCKDYETNVSIQNLNKALGALIMYLQRNNEKFAFATKPMEEHEEGAKH